MVGRCLELFGGGEKSPVEAGELEEEGEGDGGELEGDAEAGYHSGKGEGGVGVHHHEHPVDEELLGAGYRMVGNEGRWEDGEVR